MAKSTPSPESSGPEQAQPPAAGDQAPPQPSQAVPDKTQASDKPKQPRAKKDAELLDGLVEGRIVHYVLPEDSPTAAGEHRAALVSKVWDEYGLVNVHVFLNGELEYPATSHPGNQQLVTSVKHDPTGFEPGTWHFIERKP